jgi:ribonuclease E/ribonuclease G
MSDRLFLVESDGKGLRAALLDNRRLQAIEIDRSAHPNPVGSIQSAKIVRTVKGLGTFVRLFDESQMLLEAGRTKTLPESGDTLTVQIARASRGGKLGVATRNVSLSGRGVVHLPFESGVSISRRLDAGIELRASLEALLDGKAGGWIVRRNAASLERTDLEAEIASLAEEGDAVRMEAPNLSGPDAFRRLACDSAVAAPDRIMAAGLAARRSAERWCHNYAPSLTARIENAESGLFDLHDLDNEIAALADRQVVLPGGGSLSIDHTEALTAIDVNAGAESDIASVNLAAAAEIARQLRLRHIGGIIVIDFISLPRPRDRDRTVDVLKAAVADDSAQTHILPMSAFGLVEMTRERRGPGLEFDT